MRSEGSGRTFAALKGTTYRFLYKQHTASLCISHQAFSPCASFKSMIGSIEKDISI